MANAQKIPIKEFCEMTGKKPYQVHYLFKVNKRLKSHVAGEKTSRVNIVEWNKMLDRA